MRKMIAEGMSKVIKNHLKWVLWTTSGKIVEIFVDFGRIFFDVFLRSPRSGNGKLRAAPAGSGPLRPAAPEVQREFQGATGRGVGGRVFR
jgi:hypothetical protein